MELGALPDAPLPPPPSPLTAYRHGRRIRRIAYGAILTGSLAAVVAGVWWARRRAALLRDPSTAYRLDGASAPIPAAARTMHWSHGRARLGLSRRPPSVERLVLPDCVVTLAEGVHHAQVMVEVREGRTTRLEVIAGDVRVTPPCPREGERAPQDPGDTER